MARVKDLAYVGRIQKLMNSGPAKVEKDSIATDCQCEDCHAEAREA